MLKMHTFADVIRAVHRHVEASGHQDVRAADDPETMSAGYYCRECDTHWSAPVSTIGDLPKPLLLQTNDTMKRVLFVREIVKKAIELKGLYRPTAWEMILRA
jgi:hypothetical protein